MCYLLLFFLYTCTFFQYNDEIVFVRYCKVLEQLCVVICPLWPTLIFHPFVSASRICCTFLFLLKQRALLQILHCTNSILQMCYAVAISRQEILIFRMPMLIFRALATYGAAPGHYCSCYNGKLFLAPRKASTVCYEHSLRIT